MDMVSWSEQFLLLTTANTNYAIKVFFLLISTDLLHMNIHTSSDQIPE